MIKNFWTSRKSTQCFTLPKALIAFLFLSLYSSNCKAATYYVSKTGSTTGTGSSTNPLKTIQAALNKALQPGDKVYVNPGVYQERVSFKAGGTSGLPITLEGASGAIIDGSTNVTFNWQQLDLGVIDPTLAGKKVWGTPVSGWRVHTVTVGDSPNSTGKIITNIREERCRIGAADYGTDWEWPKLMADGVGASGWDGVKALAIHLPSSSSIPSSFQNMLLVRFKDNLNPTTDFSWIKFSPAYPTVKIDGFNRCAVKGFNLRNAWQGVYIANSVGSFVENCVISPTDYGVWLDSNSDRCTVRFNEISWQPYSGANSRQLGAGDIWNAHKHGGHNDRTGILIFKTIGGHQIHDNYVHDHWDGIEDKGNQISTTYNTGIRVHHNSIHTTADDGLSANGPEVNAHWYNNIVERALCGFRLKTINSGPCYIYRNIFFDNNEDFRNFGEITPMPSAEVYIYHNTSTAQAAIYSNKVYAPGIPNYHYYNNLFHCAYWWRTTSTGGEVNPNWQGDYNVYCRRPNNAGNLDTWWTTIRPTLLSPPNLTLDQNSLWTTSAPGFQGSRDVSLSSTSPALGRGIDLSSVFSTTLPGCEPGYYTDAQPAAGALQRNEAMPVLPRISVPGLPTAGFWP
jgi:parallel beta-helix repeat protein